MTSTRLLSRQLACSGPSKFPSVASRFSSTRAELTWRGARFRSWITVLVRIALFAGGPPPLRGWVSFKVVWSGDGERVRIKNTDPVYGGFEGEFIRDSAQMEWKGTVGDYTFESEPLITSSSSFAEIGHERNGSFFECSNKS
jgi:hypothetical protein